MKEDQWKDEAKMKEEEKEDDLDGFITHSDDWEDEEEEKDGQEEDEEGWKAAWKIWVANYLFIFQIDHICWDWTFVCFHLASIV